LNPRLGLVIRNSKQVVLSFLAVFASLGLGAAASQNLAKQPVFVRAPGQETTRYTHPGKRNNLFLSLFGFRVAKEEPKRVPPPLEVAISNHLQLASLSKADYEDRPGGVPIDTIILHHTAMSSRRWSVQQVADSWQNAPAEVSAHFVVGTRGEVLLAVPVSKTAFHIIKQTTYADPDTGKSINWINMRSIGIEFHYDPRLERPTRAQIVAGGRLIGALFNQYPDLDVRRIFGHGIQRFSNRSSNWKALSEPTHLFMRPNYQLDPNFLLLLSTAAAVSPEWADALKRAGGVERLAQWLRGQTIANQRRNSQLDANWKQESNMPVSPIDPATVREEVKILSASTKPESAKLDSVEPDSTEPDNTKPDSAEPDSAEPDNTKPKGVEPDNTEETPG